MPDDRSPTRSLLPALALATLLAGCAAVTPAPTTMAVPGMPNPEVALQKSMLHVDSEMSQLGRYTPPAQRLAPRIVPENLQRTVSFEWSGSLDAGVSKLAASIGYTFFTTGPSNQVAVPVVVQVSSVPVYDVFKALGDQAGARATVEVDPVRHSVQVIHHG